MRKLTTYTAILCIVVTMASCRFSEECNYSGDLQITMDWESLWGDIQKPSSLNVMLYRNDDSPVLKELFGDTIYHGIPAGETDLVIFNQPVGTECSGVEMLPNAELHLPTYFEGNIRAVKECPMICDFNNRLTIPIEALAQQTVTPMPVVKQMYFIIHIVKDGAVGNITSCKASLSGIATGYSLSRQKEIRSKATVFFSLEKHIDPQDKEQYHHKFFVLGVNPTQPGENPIAKKLSVTVMLDDGEVRSEDVDITTELDKFTANIFKCEVTVKITTVSTKIDIASWKQGTWGQINIQ